MAVLKKWGGPRSLRLLRENVGGASDRTVGRTWTAKIFRYPLGEHECIVILMHVVEVLAPQVEALKLGPDELLACQISQDETPVIADLSAESQTAPRGRTDFFQTGLFWILRVCAARPH